MKDEKLSVLVKKAKQKDEDAFQELYHRYYKLVHYIAYQITKNDADADDVMQETFLQVQKSIQDLKNPNQFKAWIGRIAYSKSMKQFKKHRDSVMTDAQLQYLGSKMEQRTEYLPNSQMHFENDMQVLHHCIGNLKIGYREVLVLYYFSQMNIKEIAITMDIPEGTVKSRLLYGKKYLKEEIENYEKLSGERITFQGKSLEAVLVSAGAGFGSTGITSGLFHFKHISIPPSTVLMSLKVSLVAIASVGAVVGGYEIYENVLNKKAPQELVQKEIDPSGIQFPKVSYKGIEITSARHAYQTILEWGHCEVEMRTKTSQEIAEIKPLYETLEAFGGVYQQLLHQNNWSENFEKINNI